MIIEGWTGIQLMTRLDIAFPDLPWIVQYSGNVALMFGGPALYVTSGLGCLSLAADGAVGLADRINIVDPRSGNYVPCFTFVHRPSVAR
jgi:hypothetical protein